MLNAITRSRDLRSPISLATPMSTQPLVRLTRLTKSYGSVPAVYPLDLQFDAGDFLAILGPSGCGKTTLLKMLGGFIQPSSGSIEIAGDDVTRLPPEKRPTNMVFQGYGLFPHMSVRQNVGYGLGIRGVPRAEIDRRVEEMIALVRLEGLSEKSPSALSGGQQQRVALARALIMRPKVLLLDEPFAALDLKLRQAMQDELRSLHKTIGGTFVFVTHDQSEAMALATKVVVMESGRIAQVGSAEEVYHHPSTHFVSTFVGEANFLRAARSNGRVTIPGAFTFADAGPDGPVLVGVRPERVRLGEAARTTEYRFRGKICERVFLGSHVRYRVQLDDGETFTANVQDPALKIGDVVTVGWIAGDHWVVAA